MKKEKTKVTEALPHHLKESEDWIEKMKSEVPYLYPEFSYFWENVNDYWRREQNGMQ